MEHSWHLVADPVYASTIPRGWKGDGILSFVGYWQELASYVKSAGFPAVEISSVRQDLGLPYVGEDNEAIGAWSVKAGLPEYRAIETNVERVIAEKFELPFPMPPEVKAADQARLKDEVFSFFGAQRYFEDFGEEYSGEGAAPFVRGLSPQIAESRFLYLYRSLS